MPVALWLSLSRHKFKWWWFGCEWCIRRQILSMLRFLWKESFLMLCVWSVCILIPCVYIKREHTHVGSSSVAVSKGFYGLFKPNKNSQRCIFRFKSLQDHRFQNGNHRCWPSHMPEILCILYSAFGGAKTSKTGPSKSGGMSTVTWPAWNLGCIVHGTHPNISYCRMWHVSELGSLRWQQWQWSIARYFWQGKGPRIWKFLVTPLCTSILGFQLLSFLVSAEMIQLKDFNTQGVQKPNHQSRDPCWTWFSYTETVQRRALQRNSNM